MLENITALLSSSNNFHSIYTGLVKNQQSPTQVILDRQIDDIKPEYIAAPIRSSKVVVSEYLEWLKQMVRLSTEAS